MDAKIAIILGATRGIGRALPAILGAALGSEAVIYVTARTDADAERLATELTHEGVPARGLPFDLADPAAPARVASILRERHGGVDIVIQNGAYMPRSGISAAEDARPMIATNSHGTLRVLRSFLPILRPDGRLIIVASSMGLLRNLPEHLRARFDTTQAAPDAINSVMDSYVSAVESGTAAAEGWPDWVNYPSKVGQVAVTRAFARWAKQAGALPAGALINAACPGVTLTDATRDFMGTVFKPEDAQTPEQAALGLAQLALLPAGTAEPYGELVRHGKVLRFGD